MAQNKKKHWTQQVTDKTSAEQAMQQAAYEKSQAVLDAQAQLEQHMQQKPGEYVSGYQQKIDSMMDQILHREGFSYDFASDPLYQGYKNQYVHQGRLAMQDSMAGAAALTGGYGSSYAAAAGSQAYQGYLNQLNEKIPALYQAALDRYDAQGSQMQAALEQLLGADKQAQQAHQQKLENYYQELQQYADLADSAYKKDYGEYQDQLDALADLRDYYAGQDQQAFQRKQAELAHALAVQKYEESVRRWQAEQAALAAREAEDARRWEAEMANNRAKWQAELEHRKKVHEDRLKLSEGEPERKRFAFEDALEKYHKKLLNNYQGGGKSKLNEQQKAELRMKLLDDLIRANRMD